MIKNIILYDDEEDLEILTGLTREELWEHDFNLDDMSGGFMIDEKCHITEDHEYCNLSYSTNEFDYNRADELPAMVQYLLGDWMENYCVGWRVAEYQGKYYYTMYHA